MKSYHGILCNKEDADLLIEAAKKGQIPLIKERFSEFERKMYIKSGSIFLFCESQSNIKRWTDGKKWSASRVNGDFLSYKELTKDFDIMSGGLTKLSYSNFKDGEKYHVVCYFNDSECNLQRPINDCVLCQRKFEQLKNEIKRERDEEEISSNEKNIGNTIIFPYMFSEHKIAVCSNLYASTPLNGSYIAS